MLPALLLLLGAAQDPALAEKAGPPARSVVVVTIDTIAAGHCSLYGYRRDTTPFLRELAARGVVFERAHAPASTTGPSHASLFSGLDVVRSGVRMNGFVLPGDLPWLPEASRRAGYATAAFVSGYPVSAVFGFHRGFATFDHAPVQTRGEMHYGLWRPADETVDLALAWARGHPADKPFLLWVHLFDPHAPYEPDESVKGELGERPVDPFEARVFDYDLELRFTDGQVRRLFAGLDEAGLLARADWIVAGDHGEAFMEHGLVGHGQDLYEEQIRVPLLWGGPGVKPGRVAAPAVTLVDVVPTLAERTGIRTGVDPDGRSLQPALEGRAEDLAEVPIHSCRALFTPSAFQDLVRRGARSGWNLRKASHLRRGHGPMYARIEWPWKTVVVLGSTRLPAQAYHLELDPGESVDRLNPLQAEHRRRRDALLDWVHRNQERAYVASVVEKEDWARLAELGYVEEVAEPPVPRRPGDGKDRQ